MNKIIALALTITLPLWFMPVTIVVVLGFIFISVYEGILEFLEKAQEND
jgi:uncharacterized membrane protein